MFSNTTITAIQALTFIALHKEKKTISHLELTKHIHISTSYLSKIMTLLTKSRILNAHRGPSGGFSLNLPPEQITLLEIVEACEGKILGDYCKDIDDMEHVCAFHKAMYEVRLALTATLRKWTLDKIIQKPLPDEDLLPFVNCKMKSVCAYLYTSPKQRITTRKTNKSKVK
ncbi:MAG: RrF2 family transcriptional regulator [Candidatus Hydrogenedens sp.]